MITILPLSYLPSVDQYCAIAQSTNVLFEIFETFPKQTCRSRTVISTANGLLTLSIPVNKPLGNRSKTIDITIDYTTPWNKIHWKAITAAYNKSPYFLYFRDDLESLFERKYTLLTDFNIELIQLLNRFMRISTQFELTTEYYKEYQAILDRRLCPKDISVTYFDLKPYTQVFSDRFPFQKNLSILDLLFNEGPMAERYLKSCKPID